MAEPMEESEQDLLCEKPANTNANEGNEESTGQQSMDSQTLSAVLQFLRKNNLKGTEELLRKEANIQETSENASNTDQDVSSALSAYTSEGDPLLYEGQYRGLMSFIGSALDATKCELAQILYPVFVHMYLELVYNDHDNQAVAFFSGFSDEQESYHEEDLIKLSAVTKKDHMRHSEIMMNFRTSKYVIRMSRDSYSALKRYLQDKQNNTVLNILEEHLYIDVFDGVPRNKQQIDSKAGSIVGEAKREANKGKIYYGLLKEPDINIQIDEDDEGGEGEDKPKKKKPKKDPLASKKNKPDPNAPPQTRIPLPELKDADKLERLNAQRELSKRVHLGPDNLPSICFYTFLNAAQSRLISVDVSNDSGLLAAGFSDSLIKVWTLTPQKLRKVKQAGALKEIDAESDDVLERIMDDSTATDQRVLLGHSGPVYSTSFSPDRKFLLSSSEDTTIKLWSMYTYSSLVAYRGHNFPVWDVQFGPFGHYFASGSKDRTARLWATEYHQPLRIFAGHLSDVDTVRFHPNSNYIATGSSDKTIRLWDMNTGKCVRVMTGHKGPIHNIIFSPNGHYMASTGEDKRVLLWELRHGNLIRELNDHTAPIYSLSFCQDGNVLASGGLDNCVKLWDVKKIFAETEPDELSSPPAIVTSSASNVLLGSYPTKSTSVFNLHFTRRNLLLASGPFTS
ncbi:transcription initiation factor TFIID subunit 5-like [Lytechinus variegatus]|uniref:transcription initiation factor TFIID subunit 5-like n=1 Tax=Lytechinus variegatus TaxID=7654 RepID=UPI001BB20265|nr:transcription initiation factor TFIID subunit 5-like [Lytechinus variegatus]